MQREEERDINATMRDEELESRIRREVIIVDDILNDNEEEGFEEEHDVYDKGEDVDTGEGDKEKSAKRQHTWMLFTTGGILTEGTGRLYRHFIAIAIMCFLSIFLTFMSLNADREFRRREEYASVLYERSVLKEELRYSLSSKKAVTERLKSHNITLIDLSKDSRLVEK